MASDSYPFENFQQRPALYPPTPDLKAAVYQILDEGLVEKVFDIVLKKMFHYITFFESLDGFTLVGTPTLSGSDVTLTTSGALNDEVEIYKQPTYQALVKFSERSMMRTAFTISQVTNQTVYFTVGNKASTHYYGFKIVNATLSGVTYDGSTENAVTLKTISASTTYNLEARYLPSKGVIFIVDGVEVGSATANLPAPVTTANVQLMDIRIKADAAAAKTMKVSFYEYLQQRNILN